MTPAQYYQELGICGSGLTLPACQNSYAIDSDETGSDETLRSAIREGTLFHFDEPRGHMHFFHSGRIVEDQNEEPLRIWISDSISAAPFALLDILGAVPHDRSICFVRSFHIGEDRKFPADRADVLWDDRYGCRWTDVIESVGDEQKSALFSVCEKTLLFACIEHMLSKAMMTSISSATSFSQKLAWIHCFDAITALCLAEECGLDANLIAGVGFDLKIQGGHSGSTPTTAMIDFIRGHMACAEAYDYMERSGYERCFSDTAVSLARSVLDVRGAEEHKNRIKAVADAAKIAIVRSWRSETPLWSTWEAREPDEAEIRERVTRWLKRIGFLPYARAIRNGISSDDLLAGEDTEQIDKAIGITWDPHRM